MRASRWRRRFVDGLIVLAAMGWAAVLGQSHLAGRRTPIDIVEEPLTDLRMLLAGPELASADVVIVAIDDATVTSEGGYPLERLRLARLVDAIRKAGAKTLALDILLLDPQPGPGDAALAASLAAGPAVIAAAARFAPRETTAIAVPHPTDVLRPLPIFEAAAEVGLANVATNDAGTPRHLPMLFLGSNGAEPAFALRAAALHRSAEPVLKGSVTIGGLPVPLDLSWHLPLRFYGPAGSIRTVGAGAFLSGTDSPPPLDGALAVVGVTATAVGDTFGTPFDAVIPGVEVQATGISELLGGPRLVRSDPIRRFDAALAAFVAAAGTIAILALPLTRSLPIVGAGIAVVLTGNAMAFAAGIWMSAALPLAVAVPPFVVAALRRQFEERRRTRALEGARIALQDFQPPPLARRIAEDPAFLRDPVERDVAVLFVDLAGFSTRSEVIGPSRTQNLLKAFHTLAVDTVDPHGGLVLNFMGDGAMIAFGALEAEPRPADRCLAAAFALRRRATDWLKAEADGQGLGIRLGLHFGPVILSRLGHEHHQQISISGNTVNLASRLMEAAKANGAGMAASDALLTALESKPRDVDAPDERRDIAIRGLRQSVVVAFWKHPPERSPES